MRSSGGTDESTYAYDRIYQIKTADYPADYAFPDTAFNYDSVGNRATVTGGATTNYTSNNLNQYTQVGANNLTYDLNGNLTSIATNTYSYDSENRLISYTLSPAGGEGQGEGACTYDPFGRRTSKTVNGVTTKFLYDGDQIIAEYDSSDTMTAKYVYGAGIDEMIEKIGTVPGGGLSHFFYHYDGLGSVTNLTDSTGTVAESYSYDAFGKPATTFSIGNRYMFTGREYDAETGLYYYRARYYSPEIGRFLQVDPVGYSAGMNLYTYCSNNPLNFIDPMGLCKEGNKGNFPGGDMNPPQTAPEPPKSGEEPKTKTTDPIPKDPTPMEPTAGKRNPADLNGDGKVDTWDWVIWFMGRRVVDLMRGVPVGMPYPPDYGDEGPGTSDPIYDPRKQYI